MERELYKLSFTEKIISLFFLVIVMTQGMISPYFYLNWILGGVTIIYFGLKVFGKKKINKILGLVYLLSTLWIFVLIFNLIWGNIIDLNEHFTYIFLYLFYMMMSVIIVKLFIELKPTKRDSVMLFLNQIWLFINLISYVVFLVLNDFYGAIEFSGIMENRNNFAVATTILISYNIFFRENYQHSYKVKNNLVITLSFLLILSSLSVKGFIGWLFIYVFSNFNNKTMTISKRKKNQAIVLVIGILFLVILVITDNPIILRIERFLMIFTSPEELRINESATLRSFFINESIKVISNNFVSGIGLRNSKYYLIPPYYVLRGEVTGTYSHNNFLEIFISGGFFAFILYYIPYLYSIIKMWFKRKQNNFLNYLLILSVYKLFIDFGSVNYDNLAADIIFALVLYGQFINSKKT